LPFRVGKGSKAAIERATGEQEGAAEEHGGASRKYDGAPGEQIGRSNGALRGGAGRDGSLVWLPLARLELPIIGEANDIHPKVNRALSDDFRSPKVTLGSFSSSFPSFSFSSTSIPTASSVVLLLTMTPNEERVSGWQSTNCGRGTSDIIWSCLVTIFLSVWTVIHLPVGEYDGERASTWRGKIVRSRIAMAFVGFVAPEYIVMNAINDYYGTSKILETCLKLGHSKMTRTHAFALDMGAFCIQTSDGRYHQASRQNFRPVCRTTEDLVYFQFGLSDYEIKPGFLEKICQTPADEIKDRAKSDSLAKIVACVQSLWLAAQVIARLFGNIAVTPLEVATTAYVACALIAYVFWWEKPQNIVVPIVIRDSEGFIGKCTWSHSQYDRARDIWQEYLWAGCAVVQKGAFTYQGIRAMSSRIMFSTCVFAGIHLASWNIELPTRVEDWFWRASALGCLVLPVTITLISLNPFKKFSNSFGPFAYACFVLYALVRLFLLVEMFVSLRLLPKSAYRSVQWADFLPHV